MPNENLVHVIDDDEAMRESLSFLLKAAKISVSAYDSADAFLAQLKDIKGGCIVTDVRMPGMSGLDLLKRLRELNSPMLAVEAMKYGASDFLEKPFDDDTLLGAVRKALSETAASQEDHALRTAVTQRMASLSARERQVLDGLLAGHPNKTIAYDLGISPRTIEIYRANVMTKMEAASLSELVRMALVAGVLGSAPARSRS